LTANPNLYAQLRSRFPQPESGVAIETPQRTYTWADIDRLSGRLASLFVSLGAGKGARVAAQVEKSPEALMVYLAALRAGLVYLPLNTAYRESEISYFLHDAEPAVVVCDPDNADWVGAQARNAGTAHVLTLNADGEGTLMDAARAQPAEFATVESAPDDLAAILYTSGTTGRSKGAMLSHKNLLANTQALHEAWGWSGSDVLLHMLPIFHVHGLFVAANGALYAGARMVWLPKFTADDTLAHLPRCTLMMGVPTYYVRLLADDRLSREVCAGVRLFVSGSAPLLTETFVEFQQRTGHTILERYGMSETNMLTSNPFHTQDGRRIGGTVGRALPGVAVRVVNDDDHTLPAGDIGYVQVKGDNVFAGYWRMPEKTQQEFTADGWFRTGDMGRFGGDGIPDDYLSIVGRSKDLIISGGFNVYPKEIEEVIDAMPGVQESAVIGIPHADFGEAVTAVVVPRAGSAIDTAALTAQLKRHLANFKVPKAIHVVNDLPRNTMGKVQKNELRKQFGA
jgi:malonyl-CoA/methylmalonyl-CoA synthetase